MSTVYTGFAHASRLHCASEADNCSRSWSRLISAKIFSKILHLFALSVAKAATVHQGPAAVQKYCCGSLKTLIRSQIHILMALLLLPD